ncbi:unnamed protein product [Ixodes hexagonus]
MAPSAQAEKVSVDARGVLIMIVALAGIGALWVNEFRTADDGFDASTYVYRVPHKGPSRETPREAPKPVLLSLEDCGKLAQDALREYVQRHAAQPRDDPAEDSAPTDDDEASKARNYEEAAMTEDYRRGTGKAAARHPEAEDTSAQSEEEHEDAPAPELAESEEVKAKPRKSKSTKPATQTEKEPPKSDKEAPKPTKKAKKTKKCP